MRSVWRMRGVLALGVLAVVGVGCSSHQASGQEIPDRRPEPVATVVGDGLLPGDQRVPGAAPKATTAVPAAPIGKTSSPVPADHTAETRPPVVLPGVVTVVSTATTAATTD